MSAARTAGKARKSGSIVTLKDPGWTALRMVSEALHYCGFEKERGVRFLSVELAQTRHVGREVGVADAADVFVRAEMASDRTFSNIIVFRCRLCLLAMNRLVWRPLWLIFTRMDQKRRLTFRSKCYPPFASVDAKGVGDWERVPEPSDV